MSEVTAEFNEPLEVAANSGQAAEVPPSEELLSELPLQFREEAAAEQTAADEQPLEEEELSSDEDLLAEEAELEAEDGLEEGLEAQPAESGGANKRIRSLVGERNELRQQMAAQQAEFQRQQFGLQQQMQAQMQQQHQAIEEQRLQAQRERELLQSAREREEEANLSPMEQYKRQLVREAEQRARQSLMPEVQQLKEQLAAQEQARQAAAQRIEQQQRLAYYKQQAAQAAGGLTAGMDPKLGLDKEMQEMVLSYSAAYGLPPAEAAKKFGSYLSRYAQGHISKSKASGAKRVARSQSVPSTSTSGRKPAQGSSWPSLEKLRQSGIDSHIDWLAMGEPSLG